MKELPSLPTLLGLVCRKTIKPNSGGGFQAALELGVITPRLLKRAKFTQRNNEKNTACIGKYTFCLLLLSLQHTWGQMWLLYWNNPYS